MNLLMNRSKLFVSFICLLVLASCNNYGKKVTFTGHKGEVYYKGDGVTEADAKAAGRVLEENFFFLKDDKKRSMQITKESGRIKARLVIDEKGVDTTKDADEIFTKLGALLSKEVFNNTPVDIIYTDNAFKDKRTIPYKAAALAEATLFEEIKDMPRKDHNKNTLYYSKDFTGDEATALFNYLVKSAFFTETGNNDLIVTKTAGNSFHFRFPVKASFANEEGLQRVDVFAKQMKKDLFADVHFEFEVMDENVTPLKTFTY